MDEIQQKNEKVNNNSFAVYEFKNTTLERNS